MALARALASGPRALLLDEPLAALDPRTRRTVRAELRGWVAAPDRITLYVTHQPEEALAIGDRIVVIEAGRVIEQGSPQEFLRHPRTPYAAELLGVNLFEGVVASHPEPGIVCVEVDAATLHGPDPGVEGPVRVRVHPHRRDHSMTRPSGSARNVVPAVVAELVPEPPAGDRVRVLLDGQPPLAAQITRGAAAALGLARGTRVWASFKATAVTIEPREMP